MSTLLQLQKVTLHIYDIYTYTYTKTFSIHSLNKNINLLTAFDVA